MKNNLHVFLGSTVADAAARPLHWVYNQKKLLNYIRGKKAEIALKDLDFVRKKVARDISKTVKSAVANAENNNQFDIDNLYIKEAFVGKSLVMKRFRPRAKGRASGIKKPFSNITIVLQEKQEKKNGPKN